MTRATHELVSAAVDHGDGSELVLNLVFKNAATGERVFVGLKTTDPALEAIEGAINEVREAE